MDYEDWYEKYEDALVAEHQKLVDVGVRDPSPEDWEEWVEEQWKLWNASVFE